MAVVTVTRLRARAGAQDEVMGLTDRVVAQLGTAPGFLGGRLILDGSDAWAVTLCADAASLRAWGAAHAQVAAQGPRLADVLELTAWRAPAERLPGWDEVRAQWPHGAGPGEGLAGDLPAAAAPVPR